MREKKRQLAVFSFFDRTHVEEMLERMARKGWMLEKIGAYFWTYRRTEPKEMHFTVSYAPKASAFDPDLTEEQREFIDFCERTLWRFVASNAQLQVFCNEQRDPVPIQTDPVIELETLHKAAKRAYIPAYIVLLVLALAQIGMFAVGLVHDPIGVLARTSSLMQGIVWASLAILTAGELGIYLVWRKRALKAAEQGEFLPTPNMSRFQHVMLAIDVVIVVFWILSFTASGDGLSTVGALAGLVYATVVAVGVNGTRSLLKRKGATRETNRAVTIAVDVVLAFGGMALLILFIFRGMDNGWFERKDAARAAPLPLTVEDLVDEAGEPDWYIRFHTDSESPLLARYEAHQYRDFHNKDANGVRLPSLDYTITDVKAAFLYDFCKGRILKRYYDEREPEEFRSDYQLTDAAPWDAREAYRMIYYDSTPLNHWILCYDGRIVEFTTDWEPTAEQMATVGEKLGK